MSEKDEHSSEMGSRRRDALLRFGRFAAAAPAMMVLLTGEAEAYGENGQGQNNNKQGQNEQ